MTMIHSLRQLSSQAVLLALVGLVFAAPSQAQTDSLNISFIGSVFNCPAPNATLNQSFNLSFSASGLTSGNNTIVSVNLGSGLGNFNVEVSTAQIQALAQAASLR